MSGDVMFHEFIKKSDEKHGKKRKLFTDDDDKKDIKIEETGIEPKTRRGKKSTT